MPLVYLPKLEALFLWGKDGAPRELPELGRSGTSHVESLVTPDGLQNVSGLALPLLETLAFLAVVPAAAVEALPPSVAVWTLASKLALELVSRELVVPTVTRLNGRIEARWAAALSSGEEAVKVSALARSMPPAAHAVPVAGAVELAVWAPDALLRSYLDAVVDAFVRSARGGPELSPRASRPGVKGWDQRFLTALAEPERGFETSGFAERSVLDELERWSEPALGARDRLRACFRLELPETDGAAFLLRFLLQSPDDPSLLVPASEIWKAKGRSLEKLGRAFRDPDESLLQALGRAARLFPPIERALANARPESLELDPGAAWSFLGEGAPLLAEAGFGVIVPGELTAGGQNRLRLRMRIGGKKTKVAGAVSGVASLGLDEVLSVDWEAVIGDEALTLRELSELAKQKTSLVRFRGAWIAIDGRELEGIQKRLASGPSRVTLREAVQVALAGETHEAQLSVAVRASGAFASLLERLTQGGSVELAAPTGLQTTLRPYQARGLDWLSTMASLGLGACLADDMGLGKTVQLLSFLLRQSERLPTDARPALLVAPTSVLGNWEREVERFAPSLDIVRHYGSGRLRALETFPNKPKTLVVTSYGLLRRDADLLARVAWSVVVLDEAQNIKNSASATARSARALSASQRFALTGTPVENRLAELWSILEFANPGLLGPLQTFRREFAVPIERYGNEDATARLRRIVSPFVLRRLKSDPAIIQDLPAKNEMKVFCTLTREQATLYKAVVDEELLRIERSDGVERKGRVLALLTFTKQICNHPAQYLGEKGPLAKRSGKLSRLTEMLEEALAVADKALIFTQFRGMGDRLVEHLRASFADEVVFLHGATSKSARDELVRRFQEEPRGPRIFVLSLKAGGTGLNLTAANHVFHFDRWWNPAVEEQATDRAYRIGQKRAVQVHKLICAGTVEEKIDQLIERKRQLASKIVGGAEQWITELGASELRELFALSSDAIGETDESEGEEAAQRRERKPTKRAHRREARP